MVAACGPKLPDSDVARLIPMAVRALLAKGIICRTPLRFSPGTHPLVTPIWHPGPWPPPAARLCPPPRQCFSGPRFFVQHAGKEEQVLITEELRLQKKVGVQEPEYNKGFGWHISALLRQIEIR